MALHTEPFDVADYLTDEETISAYLTEVLESEDPRYIAKALEAIARVRNRMTQL
ncbi:helix-turn-helix domain-containing protein, partial [Granulicella mallensis]|uniref:Putative transcriptional regulator n=1 Tax=Granulicella mallensis (strain ATCC BAA-1857 / DSM 23137 / MP5ACTX8) TaxID=682795 RepID=G8NRW8_GRAMM